MTSNRGQGLVGESLDIFLRSVINYVHANIKKGLAA